MFPNCPPFTYNIYTKNCGLCLDSVNSPTVSCKILDSELTNEQVCSIAVQKKCDGIHIPTKFGNISDILQVMLNGNGRSDSLNTTNGKSCTAIIILYTYTRYQDGTIFIVCVHNKLTDKPIAFD